MSATRSDEALIMTGVAMTAEIALQAGAGAGTEAIEEAPSLCPYKAYKVNSLHLISLL